MSETATLKMLLLGEDRGASKAINETGAAAEKTGEHMKHMGSAVASALKGFLAFEAVDKVGEFLKSSTEAAIDDQAAQRKLALALKNTTGANKEQIDSVNEWLTSQSTALGLSKDDLMPAFQRLAESTGSVTKAQREMKIAMDVSAGTGKDLSTVSSALMKANNGTTSSLSRLGLKTKDAKGNTLSLNQALKQMSQTFKGQAEARANSFQGQMDRLRSTAHELEVKVGEGLIPILSGFANILLTKVVPAAQDLAQWWGSKVAPMLEKAAHNLSTSLVPALRSTWKTFSTQVLPVMKQFGQFVAMHVVPAIIQIDQRIATSLKPALVALGETIKSQIMPAVRDLTAKFERWWPTISKVIAKIADLASKILGKVLPVLLKLSGFIQGQMIRALGVFIESLGRTINMIGSFVSALAAGWQRVSTFADKVGSAVGKVLSFFASLPGKVLHAVGGLGSLLYQAGRDLIEGLMNGVASMASSLADKAKSVVSGAVSGVKSILGIHSPSRVFSEIGVHIMEGLVKGIDTGKVKLNVAMDKLTGYIKAQGDKIKSLLSAKANVVSTLQGFGSSIFGAQFTDADGNPVTPNASDLLGYQQDQLAQARQVKTDVSALVRAGLSKSLINQMLASGASGIANIHALAGQPKSTIRQFNSLNAATNAAYAAAGNAAGGALYNSALHTAETHKHVAQSIERGFEKVAHKYDKNTVIEIHLGGRTIQTTLLELKRHNGGKKLGLD